MAINSDILKFFASCAVSVLLIFGYVYATQYYYGFGLSVVEIDIDYLQAIAIGLFMMMKSVVVVVTVVALISASCIAMFVQNRFGTYIFIPVSVVVYLLICYLSVVYAIHLAKADSKFVLTNGSNRVAYCKFRNPSQYPSDFLKTFEKKTRAHKTNKIYETKSTIYLSFSLDENVEEHINGVSYAFNKDDMLFCRVVGR